MHLIYTHTLLYTHTLYTPTTLGWFADFASLEDVSSNQVNYHSNNGQRFVGSTVDPVSWYRAAAVVDFFEQQGMTPHALRELYQHQLEVLRGAFVDQGLVHGGFYVGCGVSCMCVVVSMVMMMCGSVNGDDDVCMDIEVHKYMLLPTLLHTPSSYTQTMTRLHSTWMSRYKNWGRF